MTTLTGPVLADDLARDVLRVLGQQLAEVIDVARVVRGIATVSGLMLGSPVEDAAVDDLLLLLAESAGDSPADDYWLFHDVARAALGLPRDRVTLNAAWELRLAAKAKRDLEWTGDVDLVYPGDEHLARTRPEYRLDVAQERAAADVREALGALRALATVTE